MPFTLIFIPLSVHTFYVCQEVLFFTIICFKNVCHHDFFLSMNISITMSSSGSPKIIFSTMETLFFFITNHVENSILRTFLCTPWDDTYNLILSFEKKQIFCNQQMDPMTERKKIVYLIMPLSANLMKVITVIAYSCSLCRHFHVVFLLFFS